MARFEELDPEFRQAVFERLQKQVPYWNLLGMELMDLKINYIRPFFSGCIYAEAVILHNGRNTALGEVTVTDAAKNLVARAMATYSVIRKY